MTKLNREQASIITGSLFILASVAVAFALSFARSVAIPFVLALMSAMVLMPLVDTLQIRLRAPRWIAILATFFVTTVGWALLNLLFFSSMLRLNDNAEHYNARATELAESLIYLLEQLPSDVRPEGWNRETLRPADVMDTIDLEPILGFVASGVGDLAGFLGSLLSNGLLVVMFTVILVAGRAPHEQQTGIWGEIESHVRTYLGAKFVMSAMTGVGTTVVLWLLGLDLALVFGVLAFLLNFIPSIGSIIAMLLPLPIALFQFESMFWVSLCIILPGIVQFGIGNILEPMVMGENLDLHPITVLLTLIFWGLLWGPVGMLLSTPMTAIMKIAMQRFETTRPLAELLAGRLPGAPQMEPT